MDAVALHTVCAKPVRLYNGLDTRAMALLCGCALASWLHTRRPERLDNVPLPSHLVSHSRAVSYTGMMALALLLLGMSSLEWHNSPAVPVGLHGNSRHSYLTGVVARTGAL